MNNTNSCYNINFQFQCWNCMPTVVALEGFGEFRKHMRVNHGLKKMTDAECNRYRCDGRGHFNKQIQKICELTSDNAKPMER